MKTKHIFALRGPANAGKSTTIGKIFMLLKEAYPAAKIQIINPNQAEITVTVNVEITLTIEINGKIVGIESQGDPNSRLADSIALFKKTDCSIIVCATRTRGSTVDMLENLHSEFTLNWHHTAPQPQAALQNQHDDARAQTIFRQIQKIL